MFFYSQLAAMPLKGFLKKLSMNNTNPITIITPGYKQVIQGLGMKKGTLTGNMIFNFNVEFPKELSPEQRRHISNELP